MKYFALAFLIASGSSFGLNYKRDLTEKECPIVANLKSKIYHVKGQKKYKQLLKSAKGENRRKCFKKISMAEKNGFRRAKG